MAHEQRTEAGEGPAHARGFALTSSASVVGKPVDMAHSPTSGSIVSQSRNLGVSSQVLREHFHLPLHTVAHKFGMCTTAFKKMCRRVGIAKWPHRQLRGIDKKIAALKAEVNYASSGDRKRFLSGLISLEEEKSRLSNGILGKTEEQFDHGVLREGLHEDPMDDDQAGTPPPKAHKFSAPMGESSDVEDSAQEDENGQSHPAEQSGDSIVISEQQLRHHFHLPLHTAAQKFGICTTAFKKLCRRFGIAKWPHRQLRGIDKKIAALKAELNYATGDRELCRESLQALQEEKSRLSRSGSCGAISNATSALDSTPIVTPGTSPKAEEYISSSHSHTDEEDDEDIDVPAGATALDLLAAVAGVKERQDNEERERLSGLQSANSSPKLRDTLFDTPPMQPMPTMSMQPRIQMLVSPILKFNAASTGMDPFASSSLVGLAWTGAVS